MKSRKKTALFPIEEIETQPVHHFTERAYFDYAMYVILDRALPHIGDGLKPVQRRIIYAMSELGLKAGHKYKKSARTVGDVLGKFHPHGDSACYESMVLMAQPFSYRYPLVDGQGNWGSVDDPKSFAAMRYTEARLARYTDLLLSELEQGTSDWMLNFDGTLEEPVLLPARLPNILLNGASGIAVGMATDIPPHNLKEVSAACIYLLNHPETSVAELCTKLPAPDYPTEAEIITPSHELVKIYETGTGSIRMRARYLQEAGDVVIIALPHQTSGAKIVEQIAVQMNAKKLPMIQDVRDESDHENPVRLVLEFRSERIDIEEVMTHLFATTDLERSYRINFNLIGVNGRPAVKNLKELLQEWLSFRQQTVERRLRYHADRIDKRLKLVDGFLVVFSDLKQIIEIIRNEDSPTRLLKKRYELSDEQIEAILDLKLRQLAKLEESQLCNEKNNLVQEQQRISNLLASPQALKKLIIEEIEADTQLYGDDRHSLLVARTQAQALTDTALIPEEAVTVILSAKGWIRAAKGHDIEPHSLNYRSGDEFKQACRANSHQQVVLMDNTGRCYSTPAHTLPSARGQGEPLTGRFTPPAGAKFEHMLVGEPSHHYLIACDVGYGFIVTLEELYSKNKAGKAIFTLPEGAALLPPVFIPYIENNYYVVVTDAGYLSIVALTELPLLSKGKGVKLLNIPAKNEEKICFLVLLNQATTLLLHAGKRVLPLKERDIAFYTGERGSRGSKLPRGMRQIDKIEPGESANQT